jgi:hypothetical protein
MKQRLLGPDQVEHGLEANALVALAVRSPIGAKSTLGDVLCPRAYLPQNLFVAVGSRLYTEAEDGEQDLGAVDVVLQTEVCLLRI